ncbi:MAG: ATP-binding protein [Candidatus Thiodiazotropha taylori]|nr:ATP-binding protein [Candidatus Thiodiazotropha taylori]
MKLRTKILIALFLFGFAPLTAMVLTNLPFVLERLEFFYHKAYLQNLRADFRDLDEHLASRNEMLRLLAKLPEPGLILGQQQDGENGKIDVARVRYTEWINRILQDHQDIFQILFLDVRGNPRYWLELNHRSRQWEPTIKKPDMPSEAFFKSNVNQEFGRVAASKISLNPDVAHLDPRRFMTLSMISPILGPDSNDRVTTLGAVVINIDVGGMARAYRNTLWVTNDGRYLEQRLRGLDKAQAFEDFSGLQSQFQEGNLTLWEGHGRQVIWVPLFTTEDSGPLWVGRPVDPSPMDKFRNVLVARVMTIVLIALIILLLVARWIALRGEQFGERLRDGMERVLRQDDAVRFDWRGSSEIKQLGQQLTELAETHAQQARQQRQHAQQLEESNRYKSQFLANVSHELRTPLNSILLLSKMLNETNQQLNNEQQKQLQVIHEAGQDLRTLIDNILDLSRIEAGRASFSVQQISLRALLDDLIDLVKPQFDAHGLYLKLELDDRLPETFLSDQEKVRQILKNFLSNALKFTQTGGATLSARLRQDSDRQPICLTVEDSGIGIAHDKQELIFEAFKQADGSTNRQYGGSGLGLSISRELARLLGGEISLQSEEGEGSRFTLCLPTAFDYEAHPSSQVEHYEASEETDLVRRSKPTPSTEPMVETASAQFAGQRILVVDDDLQSLLALTPQLEAWGFEVVAAGDGQEAIETLNEDQDFSLILMDIMMPELDGYDTIRHIREKMGLTELGIIVLSAKNAAQDRSKSLDAGANEILAKPVDTEHLKLVFSTYLG